MVTWSVICFTIPNYLQIIFHSLHITHLLAKAYPWLHHSFMPPLTGPSSSLTIAPPWPTQELIRPPWPTHKWTNRTTVPTHPLTTTIVTRSNHLCFDGAFRSRPQSHHRCFSLSLSLSLSPLPPQPSIFSLKSLSLSWSSVGFVELRFSFFFLWVYILGFLL